MYKDLIGNYTAIGKQEEIDKSAITAFIKNNSDCLFRTNLVAHITSSGIIVNKEMNKTLFVHHNIYNAWGWVGGHNDGNPDLLEVALQEAKEETGVVNITPYNNEIISIDVIYVENHIKNNVFVGDHLHLNITFLFIANEDDKLEVKEDENSGVKWFDIEGILENVDEERIKSVYKKIFDRINRLK